jgi:hypothetical protein
MSNHQHRNINVVMLATQKAIAKVLFKSTGAAIVGFTTLSFATTIQPAHAFSVTYNFAVKINSNAYETQGLSKGSIEQGSFTYDTAGLKPYPTGDNTGSTGIRSEYVSASQGNLTLLFNFLNNIYTEKNDLNYSGQRYFTDYPVALFANGQLVGLDFLVVPSQFQPPQKALGFRIFNNDFYVGATDNNNSGNLVGAVTYSDTTILPDAPLPGAGVAAVPEPSELGGAIAAFGCLGVWALKKVKGQKK